MTETQINNRDSSVTIQWADNVYTFRLPWGGLIELQEKLDAGPNWILNELWEGKWKVEYISEIIRLGLIGGGVTPADAYKLTERYVKSRPPMENLSLATGILAISLSGAPEESGESQAAPENKDSMIFPEEKSE